MSTPLLVIVSVLYTAAAYSFWLDGKNGLALAFVCYAIANVGFIWASKT